jgi:hypothetical protein
MLIAIHGHTQAHKHVHEGMHAHTLTWRILYSSHRLIYYPNHCLSTWATTKTKIVMLGPYKKKEAVKGDMKLNRLPPSFPHLLRLSLHI